jgi:putative transcriptional regulator
MYHYTDGGLRNVWLSNGYIERNTPYGKAVSFQDLEGLTKAICLALAKKPGKLTGAEFRYIRSNMLLSQKSLGTMLGYTEQAVAKWEKTGKIPKAVDFYFRSIYLARADGNEKIKAMIHTMNELDRIANQRIIVSEGSSGWKSKYQICPDPEQELEAA